MAETYSYCKGSDRIDISVSTSLGGTTYNDQYTEGGDLITVTYKKLTITASPTPQQDLTLYLGYETAAVWGDFYTPPTSWGNSSQLVTFPAGQSSIVIDVTITKAYCYDFDAGSPGGWV